MFWLKLIVWLHQRSIVIVRVPQCTVRAESLYALLTLQQRIAACIDLQSLGWVEGFHCYLQTLSTLTVSLDLITILVNSLQ